MKTATTYSLPTAGEVAAELRTLLRRHVSVTVKRAPSRSATHQYAAEFCTSQGEPAALCLMDAALACGAGAALVLLPREVAEQNARRTVPEAAIVESLAAIMNAVSGRFAGGGRRLLLRRIHTSLDTLPPGTEPLRECPPGRLDLEVRIAGYAGGGLTILVL